MIYYRIINHKISNCLFTTTRLINEIKLLLGARKSIAFRLELNEATSNDRYNAGGGAKQKQQQTNLIRLKKQMIWQ